MVAKPVELNRAETSGEPSFVSTSRLLAVQFAMSLGLLILTCVLSTWDWLALLNIGVTFAVAYRMLRPKPALPRPLAVGRSPVAFESLSRTALRQLVPFSPVAATVIASYFFAPVLFVGLGISLAGVIRIGQTVVHTRVTERKSGKRIIQPASRFARRSEPAYFWLET